jgi:hypothetical protein
MFEEAEAIRKAFNAMKYARGEPFKDEHWSAMFKKLGFPKGLRLDQLTVGHFLDTLDTVAENTAWLKDLSSRYAHTRSVVHDTTSVTHDFRRLMCAARKVRSQLGKHSKS